MKKVFVTVTFLIAFSIYGYSQYSFGFKLAPEAGIVLNSKKDNKLGVGGTISLLYFHGSDIENNSGAFTLSIKGFNNPWDGGKIIESILNGKSDAFNYMSFLLGYHKKLNNYYVEPRFGITQGSSYSAFTFSPQIGYIYKYFDFGLFVDMASGSKQNSISSKTFTTLGISIGYTILF